MARPEQRSHSWGVTMTVQMTHSFWSGRIRRLQAGEVAVPLQRVFDGMSARSRYLRYHTEMPRLTAAYRAALTTVDGARHVVLVAERLDQEGWVPEGLGRLIAMDENRVDLALEVVDSAQGQGIGRGLLCELVTTARALNYRWLVAAVLATNTPVLDWLRREFPAAASAARGPPRSWRSPCLPARTYRGASAGAHRRTAAPGLR